MTYKSDTQQSLEDGPLKNHEIILNCCCSKYNLIKLYFLIISYLT